MRKSLLFIAPVIAVSLGLWLRQMGYSADIAWTAGITVLTAMWWIFEPIPIPVTSLIPIALFPTVGVLDYTQVGAAYGDKLILLMLGGFMLSTAMERSGAHRRIALIMVSALGGHSPRRLVFGFMAASAFLSMWISNSATTLMLLPIVLAIVGQIGQGGADGQPVPGGQDAGSADGAGAGAGGATPAGGNERFRLALLLGVAYAASIGGIATPIGTPPNLVFLDQYGKLVGESPTFLEWMSWSLPIVLIMLPVALIWLTRGLRVTEPITLPAVGRWRTEEVRTLAVFVVTALLWMTRKEPFGGWTAWTGLTGTHDASVALLAVVAMFLIPNGKGERLLTWQAASRIPWGILLLYAAGISIARAFVSSGLSEEIGSSLGAVTALPMLLTIVLLCLAVTFLTEVTSNTATANVLMPVLVATAVAGEIDPRLIMVPATISCSFAFMLPVATPPNVVVFGGGGIRVSQMAREGLILNLIGVAVVSLYCYWQFA